MYFLTNKLIIGKEKNPIDFTIKHSFLLRNSNYLKYAYTIKDIPVYSVINS